MASVDKYMASSLDWATQVEFVVHEPDLVQSELGDVFVPKSPQSQFLFAQFLWRDADKIDVLLRSAELRLGGDSSKIACVRSSPAAKLRI